MIITNGSKRYKTGTPALAILLLASLLFLASCAGQGGSGPSETAGPEQQEQAAGEPALNDENGQLPGEDPDGSETARQKPVPRVGIYDGPGSWDVNVTAFKNFFDRYDIEYDTFDNQDAVTLDFSEHFEIILFPGGFAAEYKNYIPDHENIRAFIREGGSFIGTCAGAYYASDILRWQGTDYEYPLGFFEGRGIGPLAGEIGWGNTGTFRLDAGHPANDGFERSLDFYYFDGPYFEPYDENHEPVILARYAVNDQPAVIAGRYGDGSYLLYGPHPELGGYSPESPDFNLNGGEGANWPWLHSSLLWFSNW